MIQSLIPSIPTPRAKPAVVVAPVSARSNWLASSTSRLTADWQALQQSANDELRYDLISLRKRAREQERNNPHVARFLKLLIKNVVGPKGITPKLTAKTTRGDAHATVNKAVQDAFAEWSKPKFCTVNRQLGWIGVLAMAMRTWARDGEAYLRLIPAKNKFAFGLQFIDADQLDQTFWLAKSAKQNEINMGVEVDEYGAPLAYHFFDRHPTESWMPRKRVRIPADQIIPIMQPRRYGALRAESVLSPVLGSLRDTVQFIQAAVINARTGASKMGFITKNIDTPEDEDSPRQMTMEAQAGVIEELEPGEDFKNWDPAFPSDSFAPFNSALLQYISVGMDLPAIEVTGDLTQTSFASARIGRLDGQDTYRQLQDWLIETVCQPVFEAWLQHAVLAGAVTIPGSDVTRFHVVKWRVRGWKGVDELKEVNAAALRCEFGFSSRQRECAENGDDYFEILEEQAEEAQARSDLGLTEHAYPTTVIIEDSDAKSSNTGTTDDEASGAVAAGGRAGRSALAPGRVPSGDRSVLAISAGGGR